MNNTSIIQQKLIDLGYQLEDHGNHWRTKAKYRNGSNNSSVLIYKDTGVWSDFGSGLTNQPFETFPEVGKDIPVLEQVERKESSDDEKERIYPKAILKKLIPNYTFYTRKNIALPTLKRLLCGLAMSGKMYNRITFPILDNQERIVGFSGRKIDFEKNVSKSPKWKHLGKKEKWIYPLYFRDELGEFFVQNAIASSGEVIIVESIGDLLNFHSCGVFNVLCCFGVKISESLICAVLSLGVNKIILGLNNDFQKEVNTGLFKAIDNYLALLEFFDKESLIISLPIKNDFGEMDCTEIKNWKNLTESLTIEGTIKLIKDTIPIIDKFEDKKFIRLKNRKRLEKL
jgi:hypothetical protein